ncbi:NADP-dependent oxidoreductase [Halioglobus japonicus]|uniref:NADP-dependent oxidoreductase n=1 Tax=Halioglobus japonicus TaxID=930805 RepID=A0AAP8SP30_9GAMM|nr:NADP-dependent oxidoreductase [Halioglobus japonicus]AQA18690.1 NADP-dependent oxidoreductase [Halioglobus japonicus]PLW86718.1 NADP-dependent oxidoreductase [Halioglobus japonicus]GHD11429.1 NADP-dependent oxidoreductase [Halioglobus japonicus]
MSDMNRQWLLRSRPTGMVTEENFERTETPIPTPDLSAGEALVKTLVLGFDASQRVWMEAEDSYMPAVELGDVMRATGVGQVVSSENPDLPVGTLVQGLVGWQEYCIASPTSPFPFNVLPPGTPPNLALSVFGVTSLTGYFGMLNVGELKEGDTVLVSGAAGATGSVAAQVARIKGCKVVGIAGGRDKCQWLLDECKLDAAIDYKSENLDERLAELFPEGINLFFDNVGGDMLETAIAHMAMHGRIVLCGAIASYNDSEARPGPRNINRLIMQRIKMQGFIVIDYLEHAPTAMADLADWVMSGQMAWQEDLQAGFDAIPATLQRLYAGQNQGKQLLQLAEPT